MNQYFDKEKGFCLNVLGGGKALYINNTSCGTNVLKPHCYNPRYYYICKKNKTILAQCSQNKHFEVHLQKCTLIYHGKNTPNKTNSNSCQKVGIFPIANDCHQFYTCTAYGHRMKQNFYICPKNMAFDMETEMCKPSSTCKESRLSSTCLFSSEKEDMTLEEANMFLKPMDKSLTCETIFTSDEETMTTERNYNNNEIKSTTSYNKPTVSEFTEPSDRNITTTIERASETSQSINTVASEIYTTAMYSPTKEEITYTIEQTLSTEKNGDIESLISKESSEQEHNGKIINNNIQSTDAMQTFSTELTILDDTISRRTGSETQSNIEILNSTPAIEDLDGPLANEEEITDLPSAIINDNPDTEKSEINLNDPSLEILNTTQSNIEIPNSTPAIEDLNEPLTNEEEITDLPSAIINDNPDTEKPEINFNDSSLEILNTTQPNIEIPNSTPATEDLNKPLTNEEEITDLPLAIINDNPDTEKPEINFNDPSLEILNTTQPNIEIPNSTPATEDLNEPLTTEEEIIDLSPPAIDVTTNRNPDVKGYTELGVNSNDPSSEILNIGEPNIEMPHSTPATVEFNEFAEEKSSNFISAVNNNDSEMKKQKETDRNLNDQLSEIFITDIPNIEMEHNIVTTIKVIEQSTFESESSDIVSEIPPDTLTSIKENDIHTIVNLSDSSMEITTPSLDKYAVTNGKETFMEKKISNNDGTENNVFVESVTNVVKSSENYNFQNYVSSISINPASYSGMISENKFEEPSSISITDRTVFNKNEENNTPSTYKESNIMKTNSPIEINIKYTTSVNKNLNNIGNEKSIFSSDTNKNENDKSISQANKLTTSFQDLIAKCRNHMSAETIIQSTKSNPTNEKYSDSFHMQSHSLVSDKKNADKQNKIFVEDSLSKYIYSGKTISKNFILPITSAVLNFIDKFECYLKNTFVKIFH
ncbi:protein PFF0380w-like isoform X2 [Apis florea]|nr:protein PFF0380w-like isoform X2 [Apis florea]